MEKPNETQVREREHWLLMGVGTAGKTTRRTLGVTGDDSDG